MGWNFQVPEIFFKSPNLKRKSKQNPIFPFVLRVVYAFQIREIFLQLKNDKIQCKKSVLDKHIFIFYDFSKLQNSTFTSVKHQ